MKEVVNSKPHHLQIDNANDHLSHLSLVLVYYLLRSHCERLRANHIQGYHSFQLPVDISNDQWTHHKVSQCLRWCCSRRTVGVLTTACA